MFEKYAFNVCLLSRNKTGYFMQETVSVTGGNKKGKPNTATGEVVNFLLVVCIGVPLTTLFAQLIAGENGQGDYGVSLLYLAAFFALLFTFKSCVRFAVSRGNKKVRQ